MPNTDRPVPVAYVDLSHSQHQRRLALKAADHRPSDEGERLLELVDQGAALSPEQRMVVGFYSASKQAAAEAALDPEPPAPAA